MSPIQRQAQAAFLAQGIVSTALKRNSLSLESLSVNEETVHFRMDVFHGNLEAVEAAGFGDLNFLAKPLHQVFILDAIAGH